MNWKKLDSSDVIELIKENSKHKAVVIFKHSTSCSISGMALNRLERSWDDGEMQEVDAYYLDLLANRQLSNEVATAFNVNHQSPQVLIIKDGACTYDDSHMGISYSSIKEAALG